VPIRDQLRSNAAFVLVLLLLVAAPIYLFFAPGHWRRGTALIAASLFIAGAARAFLPVARVGPLVVRARWFDTLSYWLLCAVMVAVTIRLHE
jgi:hypothetical protein